MINKVIVIVGPTASGKSSLAIEVAKKLNGVVISADSMQIYKGLDIGTAKVTKTEAQGIPHELIDICDVEEKFDVSQYKEMCYKKIDEIIKQGRTAIICGGTGLYINAVVNNIEFEKEDENLDVKAKIEELENTKTVDELYEYLVEIDKESAELVDAKNKRRILRAIKLKLLGSSKKENDSKYDLWKPNASKYNFLTVYIDMPRDLLYDNIERRVDGMVEKGVIEEARRIYNLQSKDNTASQAIGYKEFFGYLDKTMSLEECVETLKINTRHYAKRQITWFKKLEKALVIDGTLSREQQLERVLKEYYGN